ncbi:ABC transporter permease [Paraburkholderia strydomiana]|uniref:ABC transporter permease n=1 Tax=Paraburkholderia strydomiana TaxID=1245417 RepID=UPI0038BB0CF7
MTILKRIRSWEGLLFALLSVIVTFNVTSTVDFVSVGNLENLLQLHIEQAIVALVMTLLIVNGEIDLSVASVMGMAACVMAQLVDSGIPIGWAVTAALLVSLLAGIFNGFCVAYVGLPSFLVTLATLISFRGVSRILLEDRAVGGFPDWFSAIGQTAVWGPFTASILIFFLLFVMVAVVLQRSAFGRLIYMIGSNVQAARFSGVRVQRVKLMLFAITSLVAGLAGLLYAARLGSVRGDTATGFELDIITMVLLGGVSIAGGSGSIFGVGLSILVILNLRDAMGLADVVGVTQTSVIGALLILSALLPNVLGRLKERWRSTEVMKKQRI